MIPLFRPQPAERLHVAAEHAGLQERIENILKVAASMSDEKAASELTRFCGQVSGEEFFLQILKSFPLSSPALFWVSLNDEELKRVPALYLELLAAALLNQGESRKSREEVQNLCAGCSLHILTKVVGLIGNPQDIIEVVSSILELLELDQDKEPLFIHRLLSNLGLLHHLLSDPRTPSRWKCASYIDACESKSFIEFAPAVNRDCLKECPLPPGMVKHFSGFLEKQIGQSFFHEAASDEELKAEREVLRFMANAFPSLSPLCKEYAFKRAVHALHFGGQEEALATYALFQESDQRVLFSQNALNWVCTGEIVCSKKFWAEFKDAFPEGFTHLNPASRLEVLVIVHASSTWKKIETAFINYLELHRGDPWLTEEGFTSDRDFWAYLAVLLYLRQDSSLMQEIVSLPARLEGDGALPHLIVETLASGVRGTIQDRAILRKFFRSLGRQAFANRNTAALAAKILFNSHRFFNMALWEIEEVMRLIYSKNEDGSLFLDFDDAGYQGLVSLFSKIRYFPTDPVEKKQLRLSLLSDTFSKRFIPFFRTLYDITGGSEVLCSKMSCKIMEIVWGQFQQRYSQKAVGREQEEEIKLYVLSIGHALQSVLTPKSDPNRVTDLNPE